LDDNGVTAIRRLIESRPSSVAMLLFEYGLTVDTLCEELNVPYSEQLQYEDAWSDDIPF
jgi:uncharacterized membrane protein